MTNMSPLSVFNLLLQGHTLLERISGADAVKLTGAVAKYATIPPITPLSKTDRAPAKASDAAPISEKGETKEELDTRMKNLMNQSKVVLFMKGSPETPRCGFSRKISALLKDQGIEFTHFDILQDEAVRQGWSLMNLTVLVQV